MWGRAFEIHGEAAIPYLDNRECQLGGYRTQLATFHPHRGGHPFSALIYIATPTNKLWMGDAPLNEIAQQICECSGPSGHNVEYLVRLAEFMREHAPFANDDHLFTLEHLVRARLKERRISLKTLMGDMPIPVRDTSPSPGEPEAEGAAAAPGPGSFQYTSRVPPKKLRCLNI